MNEKSQGVQDIARALGVMHAGEPGARGQLDEAIWAFDPTSFYKEAKAPPAPLPTALHTYFTALVILEKESALAALARVMFSRCSFIFGSETLSPSGVRVDFSQGRARLHLSPAVTDPHYGFVATRLAEIIPFIHAVAEAITVSGAADFDLSDAGDWRALSFSQNSGGPLIPDCTFLSTAAYTREREAFAQVPTFAERDGRLFWRGSTTGHRTSGWDSLPRVQLCRMARSSPCFEAFDVGLTNIVQQEHPEEALEAEREGLMSPYVPSTDYSRYRHHIDIDGNTNSWPGLFIKMLSGGAILKVASPNKHIQWYYNRLEPWYNYIPVEADLSDLAHIQSWLIKHPELAATIAARSRALACRMTLEEEFRRGTACVENQIRRPASPSRPRTR